jgi:hypothetical protein
LIVLPNTNRVFLKSSLNVVIADKKHFFALGFCSLILLAKKVADLNSLIEMVLITAAKDIVKNNLNLELIIQPLRMHQLLQIVAKYMN